VHRSRIGVVLIDHPEDRYESARAFWARAVGTQADPEPGEPYESLGATGEVHLALQRTGVGTPPRVHLDIETDDVAAEVARLLRLGADTLVEYDEYAVLTDPAGLVFCVVPVQTGDAFERHATTWA
jgi:hypothetical protein